MGCGGHKIRRQGFEALVCFWTEIKTRIKWKSSFINLICGLRFCASNDTTDEWTLCLNITYKTSTYCSFSLQSFVFVSTFLATIHNFWWMPFLYQQQIQYHAMSSCEQSRHKCLVVIGCRVPLNFWAFKRCGDWGRKLLFNSINLLWISSHYVNC